MATHNIELDLPYGLDGRSVAELEPSAIGTELRNPVATIADRVERGELDDDSLFAICLAAVACREATDHTFAECLETALVWHFG